MKKIGIMGGTFNPVHTGHLILAETAREEFGLDEILFVPNYVSYFKRNESVLEGTERMKLLALAIEGNPYFSVSAIEMERRGYTYTYETLQELKQKNPEHVYYFILGADSLFDMEQWKCPELIFKNAMILAAVRTGYTKEELEHQIVYLQHKYHGNIYQVSIPEIEISSTDIRNRIREGKSVRYRLPEAVRNYIEQHQLYREHEDYDENNKCKENP